MQAAQESAKAEAKPLELTIALLEARLQAADTLTANQAQVWLSAAFALVSIATTFLSCFAPFTRHSCHNVPVGAAAFVYFLLSCCICAPLV